MEHQTENTEVLNDLIQINNDRIEGYKKALEELKPQDSDLVDLFSKMIRQSNLHLAALEREVRMLNGEVETGTTTSGKIYRGWMDLKAIFTGHDRETVLNNCEDGEDAAQKAYSMALDTEGLSMNVRTLILEQKSELKSSHDEIRMLRDNAESLNSK